LTPPTGGRSPSARGGSKRLTYDEIRDRFLAQPPEGAEEELQYFTRLGMYIFSRWEAIADDVKRGQPFDDNSTRWDECTERDYEKISADAENLVTKEVRRQSLKAIAAWFNKDKLGRLLKGLGWAGMTVWEHFVGALGLLLFGLLIVALSPHIAKEVRAAFDELLPERTSPNSLPPCAPANGQAGAKKGAPKC